MKIVITGANGFIGKNLAEYYKDKHELSLIGRNDHVYNNLVKFQPNIIINCAAEIYDEASMWSSNVFLVERVLEYCKNNPECKLIHFGSSSEYGRKNHSISETDYLNPETMYEATKGMGTLLCSTYSKKYQFYCTVIRPFTIVGRYEKSHKFFPTLYKAWKNNSVLNLSEAVHDFIFIDDFLKIINKIIFYQENQYFNIINVGSGKQFNNEYIVRRFEDVLNYEYQINKIEKLREFDSLYWVCDNSLLKDKYLNDFPFFSTIKEGIQKFIDDCQRLKLYES